MSTRLQRPFLPHNPSEDSYSYLTATNQHGQPLCGNAEGWGPLSPFRWDFTPCFLDVWVATIAAFGIAGGIGAIIYLRRQPASPVKKDWHFYLKLVRLSVERFNPSQELTRSFSLLLPPSSSTSSSKPSSRLNTTRMFGLGISDSGRPSSLYSLPASYSSYSISSTGVLAIQTLSSSFTGSSS
jgi:hypothetical protein